jgi:hypothetical protein
VTGGDLVGLAAIGAGALTIGYGLNSAAGRRRYGVLVPIAAGSASTQLRYRQDEMLDEHPGGRTAPDRGRDHDNPAPHEPPEDREGPTVSMYEHQFRIAPEALEREDLLEGIDGPTRERLAAVLHSAATSYRATLDDLEAARQGVAPAAPGGEGDDRFADLGEHIAWVLRASHDAAEEERRRAREEVEATRAEALADLVRRRDEVDELERRAAESLRLADEQAAATLAAAREEAEQHASTVRSDAETKLSSLLTLQESLRVQLVEASQELRRSLDSLGGPADAPAFGDPPGEPAGGSPGAGEPPSFA